GELHPAGPGGLPQASGAVAAADPGDGQCPHPKHHHPADILREVIDNVTNPSCYGSVRKISRHLDSGSRTVGTVTIELERSGSGGDTDRIPATRVHETLSAHMLAD